MPVYGPWSVPAPYFPGDPFRCFDGGAHDYREAGEVLECRRGCGTTLQREETDETEGTD